MTGPEKFLAEIHRRVSASHPGESDKARADRFEAALEVVGNHLREMARDVPRVDEELRGRAAWMRSFSRQPLKWYTIRHKR